MSCDAGTRRPIALPTSAPVPPLPGSFSMADTKPTSFPHHSTALCLFPFDLSLLPFPIDPRLDARRPTPTTARLLRPTRTRQQSNSLSFKGTQVYLYPPNPPSPQTHGVILVWSGRLPWMKGAHHNGGKEQPFHRRA